MKYRDKKPESAVRKARGSLSVTDDEWTLFLALQALWGCSSTAQLVRLAIRDAAQKEGMAIPTSMSRETKVEGE